MSYVLAVTIAFGTFLLVAWVCGLHLRRSRSELPSDLPTDVRLELERRLAMAMAQRLASDSKFRLAFVDLYYGNALQRDMALAACQRNQGFAASRAAAWLATLSDTELLRYRRVMGSDDADDAMLQEVEQRLMESQAARRWLNRPQSFVCLGTGVALGCMLILPPWVERRDHITRTLWQPASRVTIDREAIAWRPVWAAFNDQVSTKALPTADVNTSYCEVTAKVLDYPRLAVRIAGLEAVLGLALWRLRSPRSKGGHGSPGERPLVEFRESSPAKLPLSRLERTWRKRSVGLS